MAIPILEGLRTDAPPESGDQILAWAIDAHGNGFSRPADHPRWVIAQFAGDYPGDDAYWRWSVPGRSTRVIILGWLPLTANDHWGEFAKKEQQ